MDFSRFCNVEKITITILQVTYVLSQDIANSISLYSIFGKSRSQGFFSRTLTLTSNFDQTTACFKKYIQICLLAKKICMNNCNFHILRAMVFKSDLMYVKAKETIPVKVILFLLLNLINNIQTILYNNMKKQTQILMTHIILLVPSTKCIIIFSFNYRQN